MWCFIYGHFQHFGVDRLHEPSNSSSKPFDKLTLAKTFQQSGCAPPISDSNLDSVEGTDVVGSLLESRTGPPQYQPSSIN